MISAELHRVRAERQAGAALHPEEPAAVQTVGLRHVAGVRVHGVRGDHAQHPVPRHEVLRPARCLHRGAGQPQHHLHRLLHTRVCTQIRSF